MSNNNKNKPTFTPANNAFTNNTNENTIHNFIENKSK